MLSYQHGYHAGNFADCHKHAVLCALLHALHAKDSALTCYDFFAGRGLYDLTGPEATKTGEATDGIVKLGLMADAPPALHPYRQAVRHDTSGPLVRYAGSPVLLQRALRPQDRLVCNDAHPQEYQALEAALAPDGQTTLHQRDAWEAMQALIPPRDPHKTPRSLVVLDPAYDVKRDYTTLVEACIWALKKMLHGVYLIWYPLLPAGHHLTLLNLFQQHITTKTLHSQLIVKDPHDTTGGRVGMYGSGLILINPPWQFDAAITEIGDYLMPRLGQDNTARHTIDWLVADRQA